jgi:hypothetical protein
MTSSPSTPDRDQPTNSDVSSEDMTAEELLLMLRRKQGTWVDWGQSCQQLQKAGYSPQQIFEASGFEPIQQNQIIVAAQVYASIVAAITPEQPMTAVQSRFEHSGSDTLYEFRILNQSERVAAAALVVEKGVDSEGAREVAKAMKEFARLSTPPAGFSDYPGDAVAYHYWKLAKQQSELAERSRLIAQSLKFANSDTARQEISKLLTDLAAAPLTPVPRLPLYRLETESEVPKVLPVVGQLPLTVEDLQAVPLLAEEEPFGIVKFSGTGAWVPIPGWQVVLAAEDPVVILAESRDLPTMPESANESVLVVCDRAQRQWDVFSHFVVNAGTNQGGLQIQWFEMAPSLPILAKVLLVLRPKRVLDEGYNKDPWQMDD